MQFYRHCRRDSNILLISMPVTKTTHPPPRPHTSIPRQPHPRWWGPLCKNHVEIPLCKAPMWHGWADLHVDSCVNCFAGQRCVVCACVCVMCVRAWAGGAHMCNTSPPHDRPRYNIVRPLRLKSEQRDANADLQLSSATPSRHMPSCSTHGQNSNLWVG